MCVFPSAPKGLLSRLALFPDQVIPRSQDERGLAAVLCGEGRDPLVRPETLVLGVEIGPSHFFPVHRYPDQ